MTTRYKILIARGFWVLWLIGLPILFAAKIEAWLAPIDDVEAVLLLAVLAMPYLLSQYIRCPTCNIHIGKSERASKQLGLMRSLAGPDHCAACGTDFSTHAPCENGLRQAEPSSQLVSTAIAEFVMWVVIWLLIVVYGYVGIGRPLYALELSDGVLIGLSVMGAGLSQLCVISYRMRERRFAL